MLTFGSVCSGIEAASDKACSKCGTAKLRAEFFRHARAKDGLHSWCKSCWYAAREARGGRKTNPLITKIANFRRRYGLTVEAVAAILTAQGGVCAICAQPPVRPVVDHDHLTRAVRGILCHRCNIKLPSVEDETFRSTALAYLGRYK